MSQKYIFFPGPHLALGFVDRHGVGRNQTGEKMKNTIKAILSMTAFLFAIGAGATPSPAPISKDVVISINDVFVPGGFDSRTDAYVVVSGIFPNGCYKWKGAQVVHTSPTSHEVTSVASVTQGMCIQVLIPFSKDVRLGQLASGTHTLKFVSNDGTYIEKQLVVE